VDGSYAEAIWLSCPMMSPAKSREIRVVSCAPAANKVQVSRSVKKCFIASIIHCRRVAVGSSVHRHNLVRNNYKNAAILFRPYAGDARKTPESGKKTLPGSEVKARQRHRLSALSAELHRGLHVTGQVVVVTGMCFARVMGQQERPDLQFFMNRKRFSFILNTAHDVVVSQHKFELYSRKMANHFAELLPLAVVMTVKQVTQADDALRT